MEKKGLYVNYTIIIIVTFGVNTHFIYVASFPL